jgi:hypothetical protein
MTIDGQDYKLVTSSVHSVKDGQATQNGNNQTAGQQIGSMIGAPGVRHCRATRFCTAGRCFNREKTSVLSRLRILMRLSGGAYNIPVLT